MEKYLTKRNVAAALILAAAAYAHATGVIDLGAFVRLVTETLGA